MDAKTEADLGREFAACKEGLDSLAALYGKDFGAACASLLQRFVRLNMYTGLTYAHMPLDAESDRLMKHLSDATCQLLAMTVAMMYELHKIPEDKHEEITKYLMLYVNRAIEATIIAGKANFRERQRREGDQP